VRRFRLLLMGALLVAVVFSGVTGAVAAVDEIPGEWAHLYEWAPVTLDADNDSANDAVFKVVLKPGDKIYAFSLYGNLGFDLFAPDAYSVDSNTPLDAHDTDSDGFRMLTYTAPYSGTYYVDAWAPGGSGVIDDSVLVSWVPYTALTLNGSSSQAVNYAQRAGVSCTLRDGEGVASELALPVDVYRSVNGGAWSRRATLAGTSNPAKSYAEPITVRTAFKMVIAEGDLFQGSTSQVKTVIPKTYLANPVAPTSMSKARSYTVYGTLKPRHTAGSYPVRIYKYRYVSGKWRSYGFSNAKAYNSSSFTKYARSIRLPYAGKWRLRAYSPADSGHAATWSSGYDYVTVK